MTAQIAKLESLLERVQANRLKARVTMDAYAAEPSSRITPSSTPGSTPGPAPTFDDSQEAGEPTALTALDAVLTPQPTSALSELPLPVSVAAPASPAATAASVAASVAAPPSSRAGASDSAPRRSHSSIPSMDKPSVATPSAEVKPAASQPAVPQPSLPQPSVLNPSVSNPSGVPSRSPSAASNAAPPEASNIASVQPPSAGERPYSSRPPGRITPAPLLDRGRAVSSLPPAPEDMERTPLALDAALAALPAPSLIAQSGAAPSEPTFDDLIKATLALRLRR